MKIQSIIIVLCLILCSEKILAQNKNLSFSSVKEVISLAIAQNPDIAIFNIKQQKAEQELKNQKWAYLPTSSGALGFQYNIDRQTTALPGEILGKPGQTLNVQLGTDYIYNAGILIGIDVFNLQTKWQIKMSEINRDIQASQNLAYQQVLKEQAAYYYYATLISQQAWDINQQNLLISDSIFTLSKQKYAQGLIDLQSLNQAQIAINNLILTITNNEKSLAFYSTQLKNLLGLESQDKLIFSEKLTIPASFTAISNINPDKNLAIYDLQKRQSEIELSLRKSAFLPKLTANGYFGYMQLGNEMFAWDWNKYNYVGLNLSVPISNAYRNRGNLKMAMLSDKQNEQLRENKHLEAQNKDNQVLTDYKNALSQLPILQKNYELFQQNRNLAMQKYQAGLTGLELYLKADEDYLKAENLYLNALATAYSHYAAILARQ